MILGYAPAADVNHCFARQSGFDSGYQNGKGSDFYAAAFNSIEYKFKDGSIIKLSTGEFFTSHNTVGKPIAKRFAGIQKRFSKITN